MYNFDTSEEEEPEWGVPELNGCSHAMELGYLFGWVGGELNKAMKLCRVRLT